MTDVLGGWALAGAWGCLLIIPYLAAERAAATDRPMLRKLHRRGPGGALAVSRGRRPGHAELTGNTPRSPG